MLRKLVLLLLFLNLGFFAWTQGLLDGLVPVRSTGDREPDRLERQVRPETIRILPASAVPAASAASAANLPAPPLACLEAGPFNADALGPAEAALAGAIGPGRWIDVKSEKAGSWMIHMGRFANREILAAKQAELARIRVANEEVRSPSELAPGLSLGRFDERAAADRALDAFGSRGIRTAKVVQIVAPVASHLLRVDKADAALVAQLTALKSDALGKGFVPCANGGANGGSNGAASAPR